MLTHAEALRLTVDEFTFIDINFGISSRWSSLDMLKLSSTIIKIIVPKSFILDSIWIFDATVPLLNASIILQHHPRINRPCRQRHGLATSDKVDILIKHIDKYLILILLN